AAAHGHENGRLAGQDGLRARGHARIRDDHVDPRLEVLRYPEVVERDGEQQRIGRDELVGQFGGERQRGLLLVRARRLGYAAGEDGGRPRRRRDRIDTDVTADDGLGWVGAPPLLLDDVGDGAAV